MKSGSWSSFMAAGALGDGDGPDDEPAPPIAEPIDDIGQLQELGYRAYRDALSGGRWVVAKWDKTMDLPIGVAIGGGATAIEAWDAACRWLADRMATDRDEAMRQADQDAAAIHLRHIAEYDRWESLSDQEREDEIKRAME